MVIISGVPIFRIFTVVNSQYLEHCVLKVSLISNIVKSVSLVLFTFQILLSPAIDISKLIFSDQKIYFEISVVRIENRL